MATEHRQTMNSKSKSPASPVGPARKQPAGATKTSQKSNKKSTSKMGNTVTKPQSAAEKTKTASKTVAKSSAKAAKKSSAKPAAISAETKAAAAPKAASEKVPRVNGNAKATNGKAASGGVTAAVNGKSVTRTSKAKPAATSPPAVPAEPSKATVMAIGDISAAKPVAVKPAPAARKRAPTLAKPKITAGPTRRRAQVTTPPGSNVAMTLAPRVEITAPIAEKTRPARVRQPGDYVLEDQVGFQLRRAHQRATMVFNDLMTQFDVTPTQFAALAKIDDEGPISQNHLGRLTAMDPSTILGVVGRLVRQGMVHLRSTPGDARLTLIELTVDGQRKVGEMKTQAGLVTRKTLKPLSADEAKQLTELLSRIG